jgi:hypothetical protein
MTRVSVRRRIRENGKYPFVTPVWLVPAKKLKPLAVNTKHFNKARERFRLWLWGLGCC